MSRARRPQVSRLRPRAAVEMQHALRPVHRLVVEALTALRTVDRTHDDFLGVGIGENDDDGYSDSLIGRLAEYELTLRNMIEWLDGTNPDALAAWGIAPRTEVSDGAH